MQTIASSGAALAGETATVRTQSLHASSARGVQQLFRAVAGALEWIEVADLVAERDPEIAELLRTYGAGRSDAAEAHWTQIMGP